MTTDVSIVGIGIHPFGRTPGRSGRAQALIAARQAMADAGTNFEAMQFAHGGSMDGGDADSLVSDLGLTGLPFVNVWNGCGTGGSALLSAAQAIQSGQHDVGLVIGFDKHPKGAFNTDPASLGIGDWYAQSGMMLTTQFFALKIQRYLHDHDLDPRLLATVAEKAFANGAANPNAWRRRPLTEDEILDAPMINDPLTQYMFCSPGEGAAALVVCRADRAAEFTDDPVFLRSAVLRSRRFGSFEVFSPWLSPERGTSPSQDAAAAAYEQAGIGPDEIDVFQLQDTESGAELVHMAECGLCKDGEQGELLARCHGSQPEAANATVPNRVQVNKCGTANGVGAMDSMSSVLEFEEDGPRSKRTDILRSAVQQFGDKGYEATKWSYVADEVGIGQTALYHYFESKAHCLLMIMRLELQRSLDRFRSATGGAVSATDALRLAVASAYDVTDEEVQQMRILQGNMALLSAERKSEREENERQACRALVDEIQAAWTKLIERGVANGEFSPGNSPLLASVILGAVVSVWRWYRPTGPVDLGTISETMQGACLRIAGGA